MKFKIINDLTSDVMLEVYGKNLKELFENSALALFSIICKIDKIKPVKKKEIEIKAENEKKLLYNWLQELISIVDIDSLFFSKFEITSITKASLKAVCYGEDITPEKGETVVKAVTNYNFELRKEKDKYIARFVLDI